MTFRANAPIIRHTEDWRAIVSLEAYRCIIAIGLVVALNVGAGNALFSPVMPDIFRLACLAYLAQCVLVIASALLRWPPLRTHVLIVVAIDIAFFTCLTFTSNGVAVGLGMLLIAPLAAAGMLLPARIAMLLAACAVIAILGQESLRPLEWAGVQGEFVQAGILGVLYFSAVAIAHWLAQRARTSEALAADRATEVRDLAELNRRIIHQMQIGAIVVDADRRVEMINDAAIDLLDIANRGRPERALTELSPALADSLQRWFDTGRIDETVVHGNGHALLPVFSRLGDEPNAPVLIFVEDALRQSEQAQQIKLMSLGRLTASIAHEIRNPLGAISHAGQLLAESRHLGADEKHLLDIVHRHTQRIDSIVSSVLGLSRRSDTVRRSIPLARWLAELVADYRQTCAEPPHFDIDVDSDIVVDFDSGHLRQILFNLWDNAQRHARVADRPLRIRMSSIGPRGGRHALEIADNGPGIDPTIAGHVLEPFFTTARDGTGLGLHIARELCEANAAQLAPVAQTAGACFRILFTSNIQRLPDNIVVSANQRT